MHAVATRVRADRDGSMVLDSKGSPLDPASYDPPGGSHLVTKMSIDAIDLAEFVVRYDSLPVGDTTIGRCRWPRLSLRIALSGRGRYQRSTILSPSTL